MIKTDIFEKNIEVMSGERYINLKEKLLSIKAPKNFSYQFSKDKDPLNTNIIRRDKKELYKEPLKELEEKIKSFKTEYAKYPSLFFYGIGNGVLFKVLLQNQAFKRIIVFENEVELIYLVLNMIDFSEDISKARLIIIDANEYSYVKANYIFRMPEIELFFKLYFLHTTCDFYQDNYKDIIKEINSYNLEAMKSIALMHGNDPADALQGIEQYVLNLPFMISHISIKHLLEKRKVKDGAAIIVATGPSLAKQLPLLKEYQDRATIFCADSSYEILYKYGIKPDYVLSLERAEITSEFFNNDFGEFDKDIIFILFSLTHPNSIKYLEKNKRSYILTQRSLPFARYMKLDDFGYFGGGMSVANMAYEVASALGYTKICLVGQDLAYGKDGASHVKEYRNPFLHEGHYERHKGRFTTTAYGGDGFVESSEVWTLFRQIFENFIERDKRRISTYNCTEGGARIHGSIEMPFKEACETFFSKPLKKPFKKLTRVSMKQRDKYMLDAYKKLKKGMSQTQKMIKECKKILKQIHNLTSGKQHETPLELCERIDSVRELIESKKGFFVHEILSPSLFHQDSQLTPLYVKNISNEGEQQNKLVAWIFAHEAWLEEIINLSQVMISRIKYDIIPLQDRLEKRNLL
ncbi:PseE protein [Campylobacter sp. MIT 99-7217]|uniref:motility associated factor glycosyltransferase family protein n=1 Tax=Campylobacter sp. MIT 99-7217 TaxID=535091 RepID=UPI00115977F4|nr:motility associated factor glycosyltransferase family protein [Campylobacter sp. MIT 99-7217]TQR33811.1 PseE protein [Campylobacter sp. MIT 99-7217]